MSVNESIVHVAAMVYAHSIAISMQMFWWSSRGRQNFVDPVDVVAADALAIRFGDHFGIACAGRSNRQRPIFSRLQTAVLLMDGKVGFCLDFD